MQVYVRVSNDINEWNWEHGKVLHRSTNGNDPDNPRRVFVRLVNGKDIEVNEDKDILPMNELSNDQSLAQIENLDTLCFLHEPSLVHYLNERFSIDQVYCKSGTVLIAVNPFKKINGLYDIKRFQTRLKEALDTRQPLPPHVYSIAEGAYQALQSHNKLKDTLQPYQSQTILVSGESGAGKTETTKFIMNYLACAHTLSTTSIMMENTSTTEQLLSSNPVLESFGNAKTLRNDNSSRFGKFVRMYFQSNKENMALQLNATTVETYLLETVRVIKQSKGERNFHIFYELLAGLSEMPTLAQELKLNGEKFSDPRNFTYINAGNCYKRNDRIDDCVAFREVVASLKALGLPTEVQKGIWIVLSAILHLGNVEFQISEIDFDNAADIDENFESRSRSSSSFTTRDSETCSAPCELYVQNEGEELSLDIAASLLALDKDKLWQSLISKQITVGGETFFSHLPPPKCRDARDAISRTLYSFIFRFLVTQINTLTTASSIDPKELKTMPCICVLDIFGFEEFETNQFEQFCINFANEKLQCLFIEDILEKEQSVHVNEGIPWMPVDDVANNRACLELIEGKRQGIFSLLDEECIMPKGSDRSFARKLYTQIVSPSTNGFSSGSFRENKQNKLPKQSIPTTVSRYISATSKNQAEYSFEIHHYAGCVTYQTAGFCEKNKDQPKTDILQLVLQSKDATLNQLFQQFEQFEKDDEKRSMESGAMRPRSTIMNKLRRQSSSISSMGIGSQFKVQLNELIDTVQQTQTHYIRCMKPNNFARQNLFDKGKIATQLRYGGVLKAIEIMRQSFPVRMDHLAFQERYYLILTPQENRNNLLSISIDKFVTNLKKRFFGATALELEVGKTKVFLKQSSFDSLEDAYERIRMRSALLIQSNWRMKASRAKYINIRHSCVLIQKWWRRQLHKMYVQESSVLVIQYVFRRYLRYRRRKIAAALILQKHFRQFIIRRTLNCEVQSFGGDNIDENQSNISTFTDETGFSSENIMTSDEECDFTRRKHQKRRSIVSEGSSQLSSNRQSISQKVKRRATKTSKEDKIDHHDRKDYSPDMSVTQESGKVQDKLLEKRLKDVENEATALRLRAEAAEAALALAQWKAERADIEIPAATTSVSRSYQKNRIREMKTDILDAIDCLDAERVHFMLQQLAESIPISHRLFQISLHAAIETQDILMVSLFLEPSILPHLDLNAADQHGYHPLHRVVQWSKVPAAEKICQLLLTFGAKVDCVNQLHQTPLHLWCLAASQSYSPTGTGLGSDYDENSAQANSTILELLLNQNANVNARDVCQRTPLHYCVENDLRSLNDAIALVSAGADINIPDMKGFRVSTHPCAVSLLQYIHPEHISNIPTEDIKSCMICLENFDSTNGSSQLFNWSSTTKVHCERCKRVCCSECCTLTKTSWTIHLCFDCKQYDHS